MDRIDILVEFKYYGYYKLCIILLKLFIIDLQLLVSIYTSLNGNYLFVFYFLPYPIILS